MLIYIIAMVLFWIIAKNLGPALNSPKMNKYRNIMNRKLYFFLLIVMSILFIVFVLAFGSMHNLSAYYFFFSLYLFTGFIIGFLRLLYINYSDKTTLNLAALLFFPIVAALIMIYLIFPSKKLSSSTDAIDAIDDNNKHFDCY